MNDDEFLRSENESKAVNSGSENWERRSAQEHTHVPGHPAALAPSPGDMITAYLKALEDIHQKRGTTSAQDGYASEVREEAFWAFYGALADACVAIVCDEHPENEYARNNRQHPDKSTMHVLASAPGSGKSTLAKAFAIALTRVNERRSYPLGCVFLVHHIATAETVYQELSALLPGKVAVFSTKHDADNPQSQSYSSLFSVADLDKYPVLVVTHEFYMGIRGEYARYYTKGDLRFPRVVTFIDEQANEIAVYDLDPLGLEGVLKHIQGDSYAPRELLESAVVLERFIKDKRYGERKIETPADDRDRWEATAKAITYFRNEEAARYHAHPLLQT